MFQIRIPLESPPKDTTSHCAVIAVLTNQSILLKRKADAVTDLIERLGVIGWTSAISDDWVFISSEELDKEKVKAILEDPTVLHGLGKLSVEYYDVFVVQL
jgi:hypothetical protein